MVDCNYRGLSSISVDFEKFDIQVSEPARLRIELFTTPLVTLNHCLTILIEDLARGYIRIKGKSLQIFVKIGIE